MRVPSRPDPPSPAKDIMVAIAAMEKAPLATPRKTTLALSGHWNDSISMADADNPTVASAEKIQPPSIQACTEPSRPATQRELAPATHSMPINTPM